MTKKVIIYGQGASARGFLASPVKEGMEALLVACENKSEEFFAGLPVVNTQQVTQHDYDFIIVASWAIVDIIARLKAIGVPENKILWYQHHKDRLVSTNHPDLALSHPEHQSQDLLYGFYDLNVARTTYDIIGFLALAEIQRREMNKRALHVVIVNAENNDYNRQRWGVHDKDEHDWRIRQILVPCLALVPACVGFTVTSSREEARILLGNIEAVFPLTYTVDSPCIEYEFNHLFDAVSKGHDIQVFKASNSARSYVRHFLSCHNPDNKPVVAITLRDTHGKPERNSNLQAWIELTKHIRTKGYMPLLVPDSDNAVIGKQSGFAETIVADFVCFNVELRMALYEICFLNMGVNNGAFHLCALSRDCNYLMFKQIVQQYPHSSRKSFEDRGFTIGGDFPGATPLQHMIWEDDTAEVLISQFDKFIGEHG